MFVITVKGGDISIPGIGSILERSDEEETIKTFMVYERYLVEILSKKGKKIVVDWQKMESICKAADYRQREAIRQYINATLFVLKILVYSPKSAYSFSDREKNPAYGIPGSDYSCWRVSRLYFSRKEDAIAYGKFRWGQTLDELIIFRMCEVITKEEICK